jgi:hypothetical protein
MSNSVAIRVFTASDDQNQWKNIPINSHLPLFLGAEGNDDNINRRVNQLYLKSKSIVAVRWHYSGDEENGRWVEPEPI